MTLDNGPVVANEQLATMGNYENLGPVQSSVPQQVSYTPDVKLMELLTQQQQQTVALTLPSPKVPVFLINQFQG